MLGNRRANGGLPGHVDLHVPRTRRELHLLAHIVVGDVRGDDRQRPAPVVIENRERGESLGELARNLLQELRVDARLRQPVRADEPGPIEAGDVLQELAFAHEPELKDRLLGGRLRPLGVHEHLVVEARRHLSLGDEAIQNRNATGPCRLFL